MFRSLKGWNGFKIWRAVGAESQYFNMENNEEPSNKKQRTDDGSKKPKDHIHQPPSPCVHVRGLAPEVVEADLVKAMQHFGTIRDVMLIPRKHQALIEFEDINYAISCVECILQGKSIYIGGQPAFFNYSFSQKIERSKELENATPNHILLFTVLNPQHPINVDVMYTICSPHGQVKRIVIFRKYGVQAMVEFDNAESAQQAKQALHGADIYSGCCSLKIEFAKPTRLNVTRSDPQNWDYTIYPLKEPVWLCQHRGFQFVGLEMSPLGLIQWRG